MFTRLVLFEKYFLERIMMLNLVIFKFKEGGGNFLVGRLNFRFHLYESISVRLHCPYVGVVVLPDPPQVDWTYTRRRGGSRAGLQQRGAGATITRPSIQEPVGLLRIGI